MNREELLKQAKPILFNTEMVQAILEGRKTVTRRIIKKLPDGVNRIEEGDFGTYEAVFGRYNNGCIAEMYQVMTPPYAAGDYLYVRETWSEWTGGYLYKAWTSPFHQPGKSSMMRWYPSIHMPKTAARIFLKVKDVRVEQLQDMNEVDSAKEGVRTDIQTCRLDDPDFIENFGGIEIFKNLWNSTIKKADLDKYGWEASPWVWVIEFERVKV